MYQIKVFDRYTREITFNKWFRQHGGIEVIDVSINQVDGSYMIFYKTPGYTYDCADLGYECEYGYIQ